MTPKRIKLINCDENILNLILEGDESLSKALDLTVPNTWTTHGAPIFKYSIDIINRHPETKTWLLYIPILIASNTLIGSCGFKGAPNDEGVVEIGYEVAKDYRNNGFATEIVELLIQFAFDHENVTGILAETLTENNASIQVLKKCGFEYVEEIEHTEDGTVWKWMLKKDI